MKTASTRWILRLGMSAILLASLNVRTYAQSPDSDAVSHEHNGQGGKVILLPHDLEIRLAVNALPTELRDGAAVLMLESTGYVKVRQGTNPFTCVVSRRGGNFYPVCFDEEGARTILPAFADDAVLLLKGASDAEVERQLADGFEQGRHQPPARPGSAYMLSPATYMLEAGKLARTFPHTMCYAPFLTNTDSA